MFRSLTLPERIASVSLKLYPPGFREYYGQEMYQDTVRLLQSSRSTFGMLRTIRHLVIDALQASIHEHRETGLFAASSAGARTWLVSCLLLAPYYGVCLYNCFYQYVLHEAVPLRRWEAFHWQIYCVALPLGAVLTIAVTALVLRRAAKATGTGSEFYAGLMLIVPSVMMIGLMAF